MMHTQTDLIEALTTNRDAEIAAIEDEISELTKRRKIVAENFDTLKAGMDAEFAYSIGRLLDRRAMLIKPTPTKIEVVPGSEESPEQKSAVPLGLVKAA